MYMKSLVNRAIPSNPLIIISISVLMRLAGSMYKRIGFPLAVAILYLSGVSGAFGASAMFQCSPVLTPTTFDLFDACPAASGLPVGSTVTGVRLYLVSDFQGGAAGGSNSFVLGYIPTENFTMWSGDASCFLSNGGSGGATTNSCGAYSGSLHAPGTSYLTALGNFDVIAQTGFNVQVVRGDILGAADIVTAGNIVEYFYIPGAVTVPEPPVSLLFATALIFLGWRVRRASKPIADPLKPDGR